MGGWVWDLLALGKKVTLSLVGHSLGGIILRASLPAICAGLEGSVVSYGHVLTLNTPHLGIHAANVLLCWKNMAPVLPKRVFKKILELNLTDGREETSAATGV